MTVGIVIAIYGESDYLEDCVASIKRHTPPRDFEIIVVNTEDPRISLGKAWNDGMKQLDTEYYCILNDDVIVTKDWLFNMLCSYIEEKDTGVAVPVLSNFKGQSKSFREALIEGQEYSTAYEKGDYSIEEIDDIAGKIQKKHQSTYSVSKRRGDEYCGACMFFQKDVLELTGGFDEGYKPAGKEDSDFFFRVDYLGFKIILCKDSFVFHFAGKTGDRIKEAIYVDHDALNQRYAKRKSDIVKGFLSAKAN